MREEKKSTPVPLVYFDNLLQGMDGSDTLTGNGALGEAANDANYAGERKVA